jgi:hypothetical protein
MKIKHYKILTLLSVGFITSLTTAPALNDVHGALTAPASYDYSYTYDGIFEFSFNTSPTYQYYSRTADGIYYNYTTTREIVNNFDITMTFNRSNTSWTFVSGSPGGYTPTDTKIGSNNAVGSIVNKLYLEFNNQTKNNYLLYLDFSSSPTIFLDLQYDSLPLGVYNLYFYSTNDSIHSLYIPSYTSINIFSRSTNATRYFDAWYLKDLGVSAAYDFGVDAGELIGYDDGYVDGLNNNPNILLNGFQIMVGILVNFVLMIVNLEVFGVSIIGIFSIVVLFTGIVWVLKLIRG